LHRPTAVTVISLATTSPARERMFSRITKPTATGPTGTITPQKATRILGRVLRDIVQEIILVALTTMVAAGQSTRGRGEGSITTIVTATKRTCLKGINGNSQEPLKSSTAVSCKQSIHVEGDKA
jgi:hypothetical protein